MGLDTGTAKSARGVQPSPTSPFARGDFAIDSRLLAGGNGDSPVRGSNSRLGSRLVAGDGLKIPNTDEGRHLDNTYIASIFRKGIRTSSIVKIW